jgi:hypothetical protein
LHCCRHRDAGKQQAGAKKPGPLDFGSPLRRMTDGVLVLNTLLFLANWASKDVLMLWGAKVNSLIAAGQLWRLVTCNFLHTNVIHFLVGAGVGQGTVLGPIMFMRLHMHMHHCRLML